jgi:hypothetical protein
MVEVANETVLTEVEVDAALVTPTEVDGTTSVYEMEAVGTIPVEETSVDETGPIVGEVVGRTSEEVVEETGQTVVKVETVKVVTGFVV